MESIENVASLGGVHASGDADLTFSSGDAATRRWKRAGFPQGRGDAGKTGLRCRRCLRCARPEQASRGTCENAVGF